MIIACVASVPVRAERNKGPRSRSNFRLNGRGENGARAKKTREGGGGGGGGRGGENAFPPPPPSLALFALASFFPRLFLLSPHFPRVLNAKTLSRSFFSFGSYGNACYAGKNDKGCMSMRLYKGLSGCGILRSKFLGIRDILGKNFTGYGIIKNNIPRNRNSK